MMRSTRQHLMHIFARLFVLAPFVLGFIRAAQTGGDLRVLWLAIASFVGAAVAIVATRSREHDSQAVAKMSLAVGVSAAVATIAGGFILQKTLSVGASMFAVTFGIFWAIGYAFDALSRPGRT